VGRTDAEDVELLAGRRLPRPVPLAELRADRRLAGWELLRVPRLSVMPVNETQWNTVMELAQRSSAEGRDKKPRERA
jgi:predicted RNA-binding protein with PUA-like domain